jgi:hypothetical protein
VRGVLLVFIVIRILLESYHLLFECNCGASLKLNGLSGALQWQFCERDIPFIQLTSTSGVFYPLFQMADFSYDESIFQLFWKTRRDELREQLRSVHKQRALEAVTIVHNVLAHTSYADM